MNAIDTRRYLVKQSSLHLNKLGFIKMFLAGLLFPLGFAPYNYPGLTILSLALYYAHLVRTPAKKIILSSLFYGFGIFGFGVSWVIISIHDYGHINYLLSGLITFVFIFYLSTYIAAVGVGFKLIGLSNRPILSGLVFSALWILAEFFRSTVMTGFPWLLVATSQIESPLKYLAPVLGVYGLGFVTCFCASLLAHSFQSHGTKRYAYIIAFVLMIFLPTTLQSIHWTDISKQPVSVAVIQSNLSMRDKWDESLFWTLLQHYQTKTDALLDSDVIVMPESAIPLPAYFVENYLQTMNNKAIAAKTAIILGILQVDADSENHFNNSMMTLGNAQGHYSKRHLVPFGEYIPQAFQTVNRWLNLPDPNLFSGRYHQNLIQIMGKPIASLICYEVAYPELLREQMPEAQWIVTVSDNGWFGHSLASYQQIQMARMLSLQTGRYQVIANNDGLSSLINPQGKVIESLKPFSEGILKSTLHAASGATPWVLWGDLPALILCFLILFVTIFIKRED